MTDFSLLFVDDDVELLDTFSTWFTRHGFRVTSAQHPQQALSAASCKEFDVGVVDATLPEMGGVELMEKLKGYSNMPVVMLSGCNDPTLHDEAVERGVYRFLLKPTSLRQLEEILREAIKKSTLPSRRERYT